jgi:NADPH:quinone reductase-like Zn-dependent oxidoreductase
MLAAAIDKGGGPQVLSIHRLPVPESKPGELLLAVQAAGVGAWEAGMRQNPGEQARFPLILGFDGAGTVIAVGDGVRGFEVGDRIYGTGESFYAQYVSVRADNIAHVPKSVGTTEAGVLAISGLSALQGLDDVLQVKADDTLIIHGGTGGVGTLAVQFARLRGVKVLATASSPDGMALLSRLGADAVVNGRNGDIAAAARAFAPGGVDAVLGLAGGDSLERCIDALRSDGRGRVACLYGMEPLPLPRFNIRMSTYSFVSGQHELEELNRAVNAVKPEVLIAAKYPLADAAAAHERLEAGRLRGKIALLVA